MRRTIEGVLLVTDAAQSEHAGRALVDTVVQAAAGGIAAVQLRAKHADAREQLALLQAIAARVHERVLLTVNDRVDVLLAARALGIRVDGVHVGQSDLPARIVRELVGAEAIVGLSAATAQQLADADPAVVDYVGIGTVHATSTKADAPPPLGLDGFAALAALAPVPAVAIGGIGTSDAAPLRHAGAAALAVVSAVCAADDPRAAARTLVEAWEA